MIIVDRLVRLASRRDMEGIYTDANICWEAASRLERLASVLGAVTDELQAEIENQYQEKYGDHPAMNSRKERDLSTVREARALLAELEGTGK